MSTKLLFRAFLCALFVAAIYLSSCNSHREELEIRIFPAKRRISDCVNSKWEGGELVVLDAREQTSFMVEGEGDEEGMSVGFDMWKGYPGTGYSVGSVKSGGAGIAIGGGTHLEVFIYPSRKHWGIFLRDGSTRYYLKNGKERVEISVFGRKFSVQGGPGILLVFEKADEGLRGETSIVAGREVQVASEVDGEIVHSDGGATVVSQGEEFSLVMKAKGQEVIVEGEQSGSDPSVVVHCY